MQFLIDFAAEDQEFLDILKRTAEFPTVQGVVLDIDRYWLLTWQLRNRWGDSAAAGSLEYLDVRIFADRAMGTQPYLYPRPLEFSDLETWRPDSWQRFRSFQNLNSDGPPLVVRVCLRPQAHQDESIPTLEAFRRRGDRLAIEIETRPRARLSGNPRKQQSPLPGGVSIGIGAADYGTLGVILKDGGGKHYAVTCAHVAALASQVQHPAQCDSKQASAIGTSILASALTPCPTGQPCNPWSSVPPNELDLSLVQIDPSLVSPVLAVLDIGAMSGITPRANLSTGQAAEVMARTSRHNRLQIGGLAAWYKFRHGATEYCFKNLFEVESPYSTPGIIQSGDSGAPVCTPDANGTAWAGMIMGSDSFKGYAIYAETIDAWLGNHGHQLSVY
jgi:hypothetical protein